MCVLNIETLDAPEVIITKLRELSVSIGFDKQSQKGSNGWLFFGENLIHQQRVAVKFYDWSGNPLYHAEPQHLATLNASNIITVNDAALVDTNYAYFVSPFYRRGDLDDELERGIHENKRAVSLVLGVLSGLSHLHGNSLLHRDLKPQNIFLSDDDHAIIGDLGSVKLIPEGCSSVPGSGHSLIYRPPESVESNEYSKTGDLYQVGILLFQLLGGRLPYDEFDWLSPVQLKKYHSLTDHIDKQVYATTIIKNRISKGKILDLNTLPPWVCPQLRKTIFKACNTDPSKRYQSCSEFLGRISDINPNIRDWRIEDSCPTRYHREMKYRIVPSHTNNTYHVKKTRSGNWRNDNSFVGTSLSDLVNEIEQKIQ